MKGKSELCIDDILRAVAFWGIDIREEQASLLLAYYQFLKQENSKYNLTSIIDPEDVLEEHFIDSLAGLSKGRRMTGDELLDLGSGAGFPGVPIKILQPTLKLFLLEASGKKIHFLTMLLQKLQLHDVTLLQFRAEDLGKGEGREKYSWVTARAVAPLAILTEIAMPLVKIGGYFWAFKGPNFNKELAEAEEILTYCGGTLAEIIEYMLPRSRKHRSILIFKKVAATNERFPRKAGIPQKRPLIKK